MNARRVEDHTGNGHSGSGGSTENPNGNDDPFGFDDAAAEQHQQTRMENQFYNDLFGDDPIWIQFGTCESDANSNHGLAKQAETSEAIDAAGPGIH